MESDRQTGTGNRPVYRSDSVERKNRPVFTVFFALFRVLKLVQTWNRSSFFRPDRPVEILDLTEKNRQKTGRFTYRIQLAKNQEDKIS